MEILEKLLKIKPMPSKEPKVDSGKRDKEGNIIYKPQKRLHWTAVEKILNAQPEEPAGFGLIQLMNYAKALVAQQPVKLTANKRKLYAFYKLLGQVMDHHIISDDTYVAYMTKLRKAIFAHHGEVEAKQIIESDAGRLNNQERTTRRNENQRIRRNLRHSNAYSISLLRIRSFMNQLKRDIDSANPKYKHAVPLLVQISLGCRISEVISASKFEPLPDRYGVHYMKQIGVLKKRSARQEQRGLGEDDDADPEEEEEEAEEAEAAAQVEGEEPFLIVDKQLVLNKPLLPCDGVTSEWLVDKLTAWRAANREFESIGKYNKSASDRVLPAINKLLQTRYSTIIYKKDSVDAKEAKKITTHLLRSIWGAAAFKLYAGSNETLSKFLMEKLGHDDMEVGLSYSWVKIIDDKPEDDISLDQPIDSEPPTLQNDIPITDNAPVPSSSAISQEQFKILYEQNKQIIALLQMLVQQQQQQLPPMPPMPIPQLETREDNVETEQKKPALTKSQIAQAARRAREKAEREAQKAEEPMPELRRSTRNRG